MVKGELFLFDKDFIYLDDMSGSADELFETMGEGLAEADYVEGSFVGALEERERKYPTGLRTYPYEIAIPHADECHVKKELIVMIRLKEEIIFREMATTDQYVHAKFVFMLLLKKENKHAKCLEVLLEMAQNEKIMKALYRAKTSVEAFEILNSYFNAH